MGTNLKGGIHSEGKKILLVHKGDSEEKRRLMAVHQHLWPGTSAGTWREFFQRQKVIEQTLRLFRHQEKNQVIVLAGVQTIWKWLESLSSKGIKHHLTVGEQAKGSMWCKMQHLVPAPWLCPESHPRTGARFFSQLGGKLLLVILFRRMSLDVVQKVYSGVM